jgi:maltooligosyltrehalose trehalohydrolase
LTGEKHSYYESFSVDPIADLVLAFERGQVEEGQPRLGKEEPRGKPSAHLPTTAFVVATQNHDQVGNRAVGERLITLASEDAVKVAYASLLMSPYIPMIFMGEERGETNPFLYFVDFGGELGEKVRNGRSEEFPEMAEADGGVPDPLAESTFHRSRIGWQAQAHSQAWLDLTKDCLSFRAQHVVPLLKSGKPSMVEAKRSGDNSLTVSWLFPEGTLTMTLNLGSGGTAALADSEIRLAVNDVRRDDFAVHFQVTPNDLCSSQPHKASGVEDDPLETV